MSLAFVRRVLALIVVLLAQTASAVTLNPRGAGEALIYPYYTVNKGQDTLISVTNPAAVSKVVQVHVREGYNGRDVLTFELFLSPHDVWTAAISPLSDDGGATIKTGDSSCTSPAFPTDGVPFVSHGYDGSGLLPADDGPQGITRTREGFIEFIVGADVRPGSATDVAITHVQTGTAGQGRPSCASVAPMDVGDLVAPTGGVIGSASIVDVVDGTFYPYEPAALQGFTDVSLFADSFVVPTLEDANSSESLRGGAVAYVPDDNGRVLALDYAAGIDAVTAALMANAIYDEYVVAASLGANTDWVVTMPTKHFYVDPAYTDVPIAPFVAPFANGQSYSGITAMLYDRENHLREEYGGPCTYCPPPLPLDALYYEVNVIGFQNVMLPPTVSPVFGSNLVTFFALTPTGVDAGQMSMDLSTGDAANFNELPGGLDAAGAAVTLRGLPVTGFMAYNVINAHAQPGLLANYSGVFAHHTTMGCTGSVDGCASTNTGSVTP